VIKFLEGIESSHFTNKMVYEGNFCERNISVLATVTKTLSKVFLGKQNHVPATPDPETSLSSTDCAWVILLNA